MFLLATINYPTAEANKMANMFVKVTATPLPSFVKRLHVLTTAKGDAGIKVVGIYEVDDNKIKDAFVELTKYYVQYYDIPGFKYEIEPMLTAQEAIPLVLKR